MTHSNSLTQAAIVLNSLPPRQAAQLLSKLDSSDLRRVLDAALALNHVSAEQITECLKQLESETRLVELSKRGAESPKIRKPKLRSIMRLPLYRQGWQYQESQNSRSVFSLTQFRRYAVWSFLMSTQGILRLCFRCLRPVWLRKR